MCPVLLVGSFLVTFVSIFKLILLEDGLYFEATSRSCWAVARRVARLGDFGGTGGLSSLSLPRFSGICDDEDASVLSIVGFNLSFMAAAAA